MTEAGLPRRNQRQIPPDVTAWARWKLVAASASAVLDLIVGTVAFITNRLIEDAGGGAAASRQTVAAARQVQTSLRDAEAGVRGYLLTGDTTYLARLTAHRDSVDRALSRLRPLLAGDARPGRLAEVTTALIAAESARLAVATENERLYRPGAGSRFTQWLPASQPRVHLHAPAAAAYPLPGSGNGLVADRALAVTGQILLDGVDEIVRRHIEALRADPFFVRIDMMTDVQVADHETTFLADIAQSLLILEEFVDPAEPMRLGSEIQGVISECHGAQRYRIGWEAEQLDREYRLLRGVIAAVVRERAPLAPHDLERSLTMVARFLTHAERVSLQAFRHASTVAA